MSRICRFFIFFCTFVYIHFCYYLGKGNTLSIAYSNLVSTAAASLPKFSRSDKHNKTKLVASTHTTIPASILSFLLPTNHSLNLFTSTSTTTIPTSTSISTKQKKPPKYKRHRASEIPTKPSVSTPHTKKQKHPPNTV